MTNVTRNPRNEAEAAAPTLMVIGGDARESANGSFIDVENPADHSVVGRVPRAADADVAAAVHAAAGAFDEWRAVAPRDRGRALVQIADAIDADLESIARMLALETATRSGPQACPEVRARGRVRGTSVARPASSRAKPFPWASTCSATPPRADRRRRRDSARTLRSCSARSRSRLPWPEATPVLKAAEAAPRALQPVAQICGRHLPPGVLNLITG